MNIHISKTPKNSEKPEKVKIPVIKNAVNTKA